MKLAGEFIKKSTAIKPKPDGMDMNSLGVALSVAAEDGDLPIIERLITIFDQSDDALLRSTILSALGHADDLNVVGRVHALALDKRLRANEVTRPLGAQFSSTKTRQSSWDWLKANYDALVERVSSRVVARRILPLTHSFCSNEKAAEVRAFFAEKIEEIPGGPRALENATEKIRLCAALKAHHAEGVRTLVK